VTTTSLIADAESGAAVWADAWDAPVSANIAVPASSAMRIQFLLSLLSLGRIKIKVEQSIRSYIDEIICCYCI
jgi:hypothetical protein